MLIFGCCVGPSGKFETVALPALEAVMHAGDVLIEEDGQDGICAAYNRLITLARQNEDCEGLVLVHDDVRLGNDARDVIVRSLRTPGVAVVGAVGGRGLFNPYWYDSREKYGYINHVYGSARYPGSLNEPVDVVDGLLLALSPDGFRTLSFDSETLPAFHGYDTDICLAARNAGLQVRAVTFEYEHVNKEGLGDPAAFEAAQVALRAKWPKWIVPMTRTEAARRRVTAEAGHLRHVLAVRVKRLAHTVRSSPVSGR